MKLIKTHIVPEGIESLRFIDYAIKFFNIIPSRNGIKKALKRGDFLIDGVCAGTGTWIKPGQIISLSESDFELPVYHMIIPVVYEDDNIAVVNKPAGIPVSGNRFKTLENTLSYNLKQSMAEDALHRPGPVHRLDSQTSGLLLIAKTKRSQINLGHQFESKNIKKRYRAVVKGEMKNSGRIISEIDGRSAETQYVPVKSVQSIKNGFVTLVDLFPGTGRTHQLRKHMSESGHPIIGDKLYGEPSDLFRGKGLFLAAVELLLNHPVDGDLLNLKIDDPEKFSTFMDREERRWRRLFDQ
jgi:RluA family pseudouridine synthase